MKNQKWPGMASGHLVPMFAVGLLALVIGAISIGVLAGKTVNRPTKPPVVLLPVVLEIISANGEVSLTEDFLTEDKHDLELRVGVSAEDIVPVEVAVFMVFKDTILDPDGIGLKWQTVPVDGSISDLKVQLQGLVSEESYSGLSRLSVWVKSGRLPSKKGQLVKPHTEVDRLLENGAEPWRKPTIGVGCVD